MKHPLFLALWMLLLQSGPLFGYPSITLRSGHSANISVLSFSPNGKFLVSASEDTTLKIWDPTSGLEIHTLTGHTDIVTAMAISTDSTFIASAGLDHTLRLWNTVNGRALASFKGPASTVQLLRITPDRKAIVTSETVASGAVVRVWSMTGRQLRVFTFDDSAISSLFFSPDGGHLMVASEHGLGDSAGVLSTFDLATGLRVSTHPILLCGASDNGKWLALDHSDESGRRASILAAYSSKPVAVLSGQVSRIAFSAGGEWLAYETLSGETAVVRRVAGTEKHLIHGRGAEFSMLALSPDGRLLATAGPDFTIHIWNAASGKLVHAMPGQYTPTSVAFTADSNHIVANGGATDLGDALQIWDISRKALSFSPRIKHPISSFAVSDDVIAVGGANLELFSVHSGDSIGKPSASQASAPVFSPNGKFVAAAGGNSVSIWNVPSGIEIARFPVDYGTFLFFSPDSKILGATALKGILLYDLASRHIAAQLQPSDSVSTAAFNPSGELLVIASRQAATAMLTLVDVHTHKEIWQTPAGQWISAVRFLANGQEFLVAYGDDPRKPGSVGLFDATHGHLVRTLVDRIPNSGTPDFSPNGEWFAAGANSAVNLWKLEH